MQTRSALLCSPFYHRNYNPLGGLRYINEAYLDPKNQRTIQLKYKSNLHRYQRPLKGRNNNYKKQTSACRSAIIYTHYCYYTYNTLSYKISCLQPIKINKIIIHIGNANNYDKALKQNSQALVYKLQAAGPLDTYRIQTVKRL